MLPVYLSHMGADWLLTPLMLKFVMLYVLFIAFMMVSTIPTYSGKKVGTRVPREYVIPLSALLVLLVAVLVAGRSGSAMTAQLGVMRVTEEIDALATMGISRHVRLVLPKVVALFLAMPLLTLWCSAVAIVGGMVSAWLQLGIGFEYFLQALPRAVPFPNLVIGLSKGAAFGALIALVACHFGLRVKPNTESLAAHTTASVVTAITLVILTDAVFAIATRSIGVPG